MFLGDRTLSKDMYTAMFLYQSFNFSYSHHGSVICFITSCIYSQIFQALAINGEVLFSKPLLDLGNGFFGLLNWESEGASRSNTVGGEHGPNVSRCPVGQYAA